MNNDLEIGYVIEINGNKVVIETNSNANDLTYFYNGVVYKGVGVGQYIGILRGPYVLIGRIEKEFLIDLFQNTDQVTYLDDRFRRRLDVQLIGYFINNKFELGIISYPMIYNKAIMLSLEQIEKIIYPKKHNDDKYYIKIGTTVNEKVPVNIDITKLFNTHIGIFGNTGSGKSNTLTKIYTELFDKDLIDINLDKSEFLFIDFNGEYTGENVLSAFKKVINLSTHGNSKDKITLSKQNFWDIETLSILFSATEKTQKPFLKNAINFFLDEETFEITDDKIISGISSAFYNTFFSNNCKETNKLLHLIYDVIGLNEDKDKVPFYNYIWHNNGKSYYDGGSTYVSKYTEDIIRLNQSLLKKIINDKRAEKISKLTTTERMKIAIYCHLVYSISYGTVQYEFISPLIERLKSRTKIIDKLIEIDDKQEEFNITVVSLKNCNIEAKKMIPLLLAKNSYINHKKKNGDIVNSSFHMIIDEAHNILSSQSIREESTWKDYRLETFEEIIKEGRKFGYFITLASQRPSDISHTLISQLHNYFIHRLVSEHDLTMINNTINTMDKVSKGMIPLLSPGQCVATGTSFLMPILIQVNKLPREYSPNSENIDLEKLWF